MTAPRIAPLEPPFDAETQAALAKRMPRTSNIPPLALFRTLLREKNLADAMFPMGTFHLSYKPDQLSAIVPRDREIIIDRVCARCVCEYEWGVHAAYFAAKVGLTEEHVEATVLGDHLDPAWTEHDRLLVRMVDALHDTSQISDELWRELASHWSEAQLLQLLVLVGWYHAISYVANAARVPLEPWARRFPGPREPLAAGS